MNIRQLDKHLGRHFEPSLDRRSGVSHIVYNHRQEDLVLLELALESLQKHRALSKAGGWEVARSMSEMR